MVKDNFGTAIKSNFCLRVREALRNNGAATTVIAFEMNQQNITRKQIKQQ